jgi:hypothetical protein
MGQLVVNLPNRPEDEMIDCGVYGPRLNMHSYDIPGLEEDVVLGYPLAKGKKLPAYGESKATEAKKATEAAKKSLGTPEKEGDED